MMNCHQKTVQSVDIIPLLNQENGAVMIEAHKFYAIEYGIIAIYAVKIVKNEQDIIAVNFLLRRRIRREKELKRGP
jgi:hypothetical protein